MTVKSMLLKISKFHPNKNQTIMSENTKPRFELWRRLKYQHGVQLTNPQLDTIEAFFHESIKHSIFHVGMYRAINIVFSIAMLAGIVIFWNAGSTVKWFIAITMAVFVIYNIIHLLINVWMFKTLPEPELMDDQEIPTNVQHASAYGHE